MMTLMELQRRVATAVMGPLTSSGGIASRTIDGRPLCADEAIELIKPNDQLTSLQRLEIYNRQYWFRVLDSLYEDFPGLCAILGSSAFDRLCRAYLTDCPSQSFTLRNLGSRLEGWLRNHPEFGGKNLTLALDMVRLEWAHIEAFDNAEATALGPEDLLDLGPHLRMALQPYISLMEVHYPVDDLRIRVNAVPEEHGAASNAVTGETRRELLRKFTRVGPEQIFLAVHRLDSTVYYRRLESEEFHLLEALRQGKPIAEVIQSALDRNATKVAELPAVIETCFATWSQLGWLCKSTE